MAIPIERVTMLTSSYRAYAGAASKEATLGQ